MPQNEYIEQHIKQHGRRLDHEERKRKREAREGHRIAKDAQELKGWRGKQFAKKRYSEKVAMKKKIKAHQESKVKGPSTPKQDEGEALPTYLLDQKADKFSVPLPKVKGISEEEMFKVIKTGKSKSKSWKRMITKHTFVGEGFTRRPVKMERIIRPSALRQKKANVTHPELGVTVFLPILGVKKNPQSPMYTQLGVLTKGTIIEVNVSELGLVTAGGKVVWGKYAQITNEPDRDGCVNAVLLV
ncbi:Ribosome biogenesis protein [Cerrena zonata]|uniref:Ribosome biogenesis protein NSA2 homolog n=1 Tax=Cerrena zonata TaxID=2478898 RepID=A0AAW0FHH0_9APHY